MYFDSLRRRLIDQVRGAIQAGEVTERGLAVQIGISQPHLHNILKGVRALTPELADRLLGRLHLSVYDLMEGVPPDRVAAPAERAKRIPFISAAALADARWPVFVTALYAVPVPLLEGVSQPAVTQLPRDEEMGPLCEEGSLGLVETAKVGRDQLSEDDLYLVQMPRGGVAVRWVRVGARCLYLATARSLRNPAEWEVVETPRSEWTGMLAGRLISFAKPPGYRFQELSLPRIAN